MKPISLTKAAVFVALAASAQAALAADGNVNFVGKIVDTPCSISPNSTNLTVPLGTVSKSVLDGGAGKRSAPQVHDRPAQLRRHCQGRHGVVLGTPTPPSRPNCASAWAK